MQLSSVGVIVMDGRQSKSKAEADLEKSQSSQINFAVYLLPDRICDLATL